MKKIAPFYATLLNWFQHGSCVIPVIKEKYNGISFSGTLKGDGKSVQVNECPNQPSLSLSRIFVKEFGKVQLIKIMLRHLQSVDTNEKHDHLSFVLIKSFCIKRKTYSLAEAYRAHSGNRIKCFCLRFGFWHVQLVILDFHFVELLLKISIYY